MTTTLRESPSHQRYLEAGCTLSRTEVGHCDPGWTAPSQTLIHYYGHCRICGIEMRDVDECGYEDVAHSPYTGARYGEPDVTICVLCAMATFRDGVDLTGRTARCACGEERPSDWDLPFFEYVGPGSEQALDKCVCGYTSVAHDPTVEHMARIERDGRTHFEHFMERLGPHEFTPMGGSEPDRYYCGCRGWD